MDWKEDRIGAAKNGSNPLLITELEHCYVVIGDTQFLRGYCVLLPKEKYLSLNDMPLDSRIGFLKEMSLVGDAIIHICKPLRINYDILGNTDAYLHAHIFPRYESESAERRKMPVWLYDNAHWTDERFQYSQSEHGSLKELLKNKIEALNKNN